MVTKADKTEPEPEPKPVDGPLTVTQALAKLSGDLGPIAKADQMTGRAGNYTYRGIDALLRKASPLMAAHGITFLPNVAERHVEAVAVGNDKSWRLVTLIVAYTVTGPAGDSITVTTCGEGLDGGDKAANKAMTSAFKQALVQALTISDGHDDPDHDPTPDQAGQRTRAAAPARSNGAPHATTISPAGDRSEQETAIRAILSNLPADEATELRSAFGARFGSGLLGLPVDRHAEALAWVEERLTLGTDPADPKEPLGNEPDPELTTRPGSG